MKPIWVYNIDHKFVICIADEFTKYTHVTLYYWPTEYFIYIQPK